jgi:adenosyl cobinamide kinase/adenosyl cobinamide phosphate guanylyltransferase
MSIESSLHLLLEEIVPNLGNDEQAVIIAEASDIFKKTASKMTKTASDNSRLVESKMTDAILIAMSNVSEMDSSNEFIDAQGLSHEQIVRKASAVQNDWNGMNVLNPKLLDDLFSETEEPEVVIDDTMHETTAFHTPGRGSHWSDFLSRTS